MLGRYIERIRAAYADNTPLVLQGGGSKSFYGNAGAGEILLEHESRTFNPIPWDGPHTPSVPVLIWHLQTEV